MMGRFIKINICPFILLILITSPAFSQNQEGIITTKSKAKFDQEIAIMGGGINFSIPINGKLSLGIGGSAYYFNLSITPNYYSPFSTTSFEDRQVFDYLRGYTFLRYKKSRKIIIESRLKYSLTGFGENAITSGLYGIETGLIIGDKKIKYKISFTASMATYDGTLFLFITPLVLCFNI